MNRRTHPAVVSIVGWKNSGKTTLIVALAAELKRRGLRVASMKHGHHGFEIDQPGRDSWRHFHEGEVEAVVLVSSEKVALIARLEDSELDPRELIERYLTGRGYDLVLVEGFKRGPFPKVEVFRKEVHDRPLFAEPESPGSAAARLALVTNAPVELPDEITILRMLPDGSHVTALADLIERLVPAHERS